MVRKLRSLSKLDWLSSIYEKLNLKFSLVRVTKAQREVQVRLYSLFNLGCRWEWGHDATTQPLYSRERDQVHVVEEVGWALRPLCTHAEKLAHTEILNAGFHLNSYYKDNAKFFAISKSTVGN
jgi:hypothetical protein